MRTVLLTMFLGAMLCLGGDIACGVDSDTPGGADPDTVASGSDIDTAPPGGEVSSPAPDSGAQGGNNSLGDSKSGDGKSDGPADGGAQGTSDTQSSE